MLQQLSLAVSKAIQAGRATGKFNISGKDLDVLPDELWDFSLALPVPSAQDAGSNWWESNEPSRLDVSRNRLSHLSEQVANWPSLTAVDVSHNKITTLPGTLASMPLLSSLLASNNMIEELPPLPGSLVVLHSQYNKLTRLPEVLGHCIGLTTMDVSHNNLTSIPSQVIAHCTGLVTLLLSHNKITALPETGWQRLTKLQVLQLEYNQLTTLPSGLGGATGLIELHAGFNRITALPGTLSGCKSLKHLSVRDNPVSEYPEQLCNLELRVLDMQNCDLSNLPAELGNMSSLKSICLEGNALKTIRRPLITGPTSSLLRFLQSRLPLDQQRGSCTAQSGNVFGVDSHQLAAEAARKLAISTGVASHDTAAQHGYQHQQRQGEGLGGVQRPGGPGKYGTAPPPFATESTHRESTASIQQRHSSFNASYQSQEGPASGPNHPSTGSMSNMQHDARAFDQNRGVMSQRASAGFNRQVSGTAPSHIVSSAGQGNSTLTKGAELVLKDMKLTEVPTDVWLALPGLGKLDLSNNQIRMIPSEALTNAPLLRALLLASLPLTTWPLPTNVPGCLVNLQQLCVSGCSQIRDIPTGALSSCQESLTSLDLSGVPGASRMPSGTLSSLKKLEALDLSGTGLAAFPGEVLHLAGSLRNLRLMNNRINSIPEAISNMTRLEELHMANNDLTGLPPQLGLLQATLRALSVDGNPLRTIRRPILEKGTANLLAYLKDRIPV